MKLTEKDQKDLGKHVNQAIGYNEEEVKKEVEAYLHRIRDNIAKAAVSERDRIIDTLSPTKRYSKKMVVDILDQGIAGTLGIIGVHMYAEPYVHGNGTFEEGSIAGLYFAKINN